ncbi:DUF6491 family protein [Chitiniphilus eburneus]|uniref:Uncharacterized protein n=1 Tax=Chitiniphilus eburneus TaxID=2571148 RepID=A0A4U0PS46_9NEIS|nr:DUF6491 family protein [Chitiniphilus eburneus]TJZ65814.1 hypothetical protein FAZ21_17875 [Chitiniphilus eburneus]
MPLIAALLMTLGLAFVPAAQGASGVPTASVGTPVSAGVRRHLRVPTTMRWRAIDKRDVLLWTGREEVWHLQLAGDCRALPTTGRLGFTAHRGHLVAGRDEIRGDGGACTIANIVAAPPAPRDGNPQAPTYPAWRIEVSRHTASNGAVR